MPYFQSRDTCGELCFKMPVSRPKFIKNYLTLAGIIPGSVADVTISIMSTKTSKIIPTIRGA